MTRPRMLRPRERRLVIMAGGLIGCWAVVSFVVQPLWDRAQDLQREVEVKTQKLDALGRLVAQASSVERRYQAVAAYVGASDAAGAHGAQQALLDELEQLSRQTNVTLNLKPRPLKREEDLGRFEVELDVEGAQANLLTFLDALLGMNRLLTIDRLHLATIPAKTDLLRATIVLQHLALQ